MQLHLVDLRPAWSERQEAEQDLYRRFRAGEDLTPEEAEEMLPDRDAFARLWRYVSSRCGQVTDTPVRLAKRVARKGDEEGSVLRTLICLDALEELDLLRVEKTDGEGLHIMLKQTKGRGKASLGQAPVMKKLGAIARSGQEARA